MSISNQPPKGTADWFPEEFKIRKYIFDTWRSVCISFGYEEYMTPIVESAEVYRAKSGEDVGGKELMTMFDRAERELAIRPEMTPSVTRMVSRFYDNAPKPLRLFSIANFLRNEKPQKGRNREFWQLNCDIFGSDSVGADLEILQLSLEIMKAFKAPKGSFTLFLNNRKLIDAVLNDLASVSQDQRTDVVRVLDKWQKLSVEEVDQKLTDLGLNSSQIEILKKFMQSSSKEELLKNLPEVVKNDGFNELGVLLQRLEESGYSEWVKFQPNIIRGFDYYDGMVFEVFDNNPENSRSLFGGGRYNGLASIFGNSSFPAVGFAPGDETTKLFLEGWNLLEDVSAGTQKKYFVPILDQSAVGIVQKVSAKLRAEGFVVETGLEEQKFGKALEYANRKSFDFVILIGADELLKNIYLEKDMKTGEQRQVEINF
jgi:histidyl-tRNA synthetase